MEQVQPQKLSEQVVPIKYIGLKDEKQDNVNHSGTVWKKGQTLAYPTKYAKALLVHTSVWRLGKADDIGKITEDQVAVVAASAGDLEFGSWGGPERREEDESRPQSDLVHDREGSTKQHRISLE